MSEPYNAPYRRRFNDPRCWASNGPTYANWAAEATRQKVNELSWEMAGEQVAEEIEAVLSGDAPMPSRVRRGDPGE